ncbi:MAG: glycerophosphodiester phosphodiesterase [Chloroflexota bacterium]|nr:glycerophosphodiester phosphodiesterase [Chloroflexota bacterium]
MTTASEPQPLASRLPSVRTVLRLSEAFVVLLALAVIAGCLAVLWVLVTDPLQGEQWTSGLRPTHFYRELDAELLEDYAGTFVVAHNSGDTVPTALEALGSGADVIEVDVVSLDGTLYAAHDVPSSLFGGQLFRGPQLDRIWLATGGARAIKLDLKETSPAFTELVIGFLEERRGPRRVIVVSSSADQLRRIAEAEPRVFRMMSIPTVSRFEQLVEDPELVELLDGISVYHPVLTAERVEWAKANNLLTFAWTVNSLERVNELVQLGVDAITTDNLAIMRLLGGRLGTQRPLERPEASPTAGD